MKIEFFAPSTMMSQPPEVLMIIAALAPTVLAFRRAQLAHVKLRLTPAQQFAVRCRWRQLSDPVQNMFGHMVRGRRLPSGRHDGPREAWYSCGARRKRKYYVNGKRHGTSLMWYSHGNLMQSLIYVDDRLHGDCKEWYQSGLVHQQYTYIAGQLHGECMAYDDAGNLIDHSTYDKHNMVFRHYPYD